MELQRVDFGMDVEGIIGSNNGESDAVSLEGSTEVVNFDIGWMYHTQPSTSNARVLYDNVVIEDISDDEVIDST